MLCILCRFFLVYYNAEADKQVCKLFYICYTAANIELARV